MTTPHPVDPLVQLGHKIRDEAELAIAHLHLKYWIGIFAALGLLCYGGAKAYGWYEGRAAKLESQDHALQQKLEAATAASDVWRTQALAIARMRRVDTVHTNSILMRTPTFTAPIPISHPDGTVSEVPMPVVLRSAFDSAGVSCLRERHDCNAQLAALTNAMAADSDRINDLSELYSNAATEVRIQKHANLWTKLSWGSGGAIAGFSAGFAAGSLSCHR